MFAIKQGVKPSNINIVSTSLYFFAVFEYFQNKPFTLKIEDELFNRIGKADYPEFIIYWNLKKFKPEIFVDRLHIEEVIRKLDTYRIKAKHYLQDLKRILNGAKYVYSDYDFGLDNKQSVYIINPKSKKDAFNLFYSTFDKKGLYLVKTSEPYGKYTVALVETKIADKKEYILTNRPQNFKTRYLKAKKVTPLEPLPYPVFSDNDTITENSKVTVLKVPRHHALYYRNLWIHRLTFTDAELHTAWLIDGKIFGVAGFVLNKVMRLQKKYIFEVYGINVPNRKYHLNRLLMMLLTTEQFLNFLRSQYDRTGTLSIADVRAFRTVCLSKYRKLRTNVGVLRVVERHKLDNGSYHIVYESDFRKETFQDAIRRFVKENASERVN